MCLRLLDEEITPNTDVHDPACAESIKRRVSPTKREFIELRVCARIDWYAKTINTLNHARDLVSGAVAAGGAVIAGLTAIHPKTSGGLSWQNYVVIALGVIVAILGAIGPRALRAQQVERYRRGANRLRSEAWRFALKRGPYAEDDVEKAFSALVDKVDEIERDATATDSDITHET